MLKDHPSFYLPNLYTFQNKNTFLGSFQGLRFRVRPGTEGEGDTARPVLEALVWYGQNCLELSQVEAQASFPLTEEGRNAAIQWLEEQYFRMKENGREAAEG